MEKRNRFTFLFIILIVPFWISVKAATPAKTFCNPLNLNYRFMVDAVDAREAADPVMVLFKGDYYLFASRSGGYWTSPDLHTWRLIVPSGIDIESYAPAVIAMRDTLFYLPGGSGQIYKTADPKSGLWQKGPLIKGYGDPAFFLDDDGRLYLSYGVSNAAPISIVELDPLTFREKGSSVNVVYADAKRRGWERRGDDNLLDEQPWIEGSQLIKHNGKYYLLYSAPGTEFKTYADGVYTASSPLGPYEYAPYSPFSFKPSGFITGAGHGWTFQDKSGRWWRVVTMTISVKHMFERRLGLFPVDFDADGVIRCNTTWGDYPQFLPDLPDRPIDENWSGMLLLSHKKKVRASSSLSGHGPELAVDEEVRTYWSAATGNADEWLLIDLGKDCSIEAVQVNFAEHNTIPEQVRGRSVSIYQQYLLEWSSDGENWETLADKSRNTEDVPHDYIELPQPVTARYVRLTNVFTPGGGTFAVRDLRIFGNLQRAVLTPVTEVKIERNSADGRDAVIRWSPVQDADGYLIRYGIAPNKLYNSFIVYDADTLVVHCLNHGTEYYFSVQAFDAGVDYYKPIGEFRSRKSGLWSDPSSWARFDGNDWVYPAPKIPDHTDGAVIIGSGDTLLIDQNVRIDELKVETNGVLRIARDAVLAVDDALGIDLSVEGTLLNCGNIVAEPAATISFFSHGTYEHLQDGGTIPSAAWRPYSTCRITGIMHSAPENLSQNFYHFIWDCPDQDVPLELGWNQNTIGGNVIINRTGRGALQLCSSSIAGKAEVTIIGDLVQTGGVLTAGSNNGGEVVIHHKGNLSVTGGHFAVCRGAPNDNGSTLWNLYGNAEFRNAAAENSPSHGSALVFVNPNAPQKLTLSQMTFSDGGLPIIVAEGATLDMGESVLEGNGLFHLRAGATFFTGHSQGVDGSLACKGEIILETGTSYGFSGTVSQVTGTRMPEVVRDLIIRNGKGVTLSHSVQVNGTLELAAGALQLGSNRLAYGAEASLKYSGESAQLTKDAEFPETNGPKRLIIANAKKVTLHAPRAVAQLELGGKLELGPHTLTVGAASSADIRSYAVTSEGGMLKVQAVGAEPVLFPVGTISYAPVWIKNDGQVDAIAVGALPDNDPAPFGGRVRVKWNIVEETPGGGRYALQFGWTSQESNEFRNDRAKCARIFCLNDTTEAGSGDYVMQFETQPYTVARGGITELGLFAVGLFRRPSEVKTAESAPTMPFVFRCHPNPCNPATTLYYTLSQAAEVRIAVYDLLGRQAEVLFEGRQNAGDYALKWQPDHLPSGVYFCRMTSNTHTVTRKITILR